MAPAMSMRFMRRPPSKFPSGLASLGRTTSAISDCDSFTVRGCRWWLPSVIKINSKFEIFKFKERGMVRVAYSARMPFQVCGDIAFRLALNADIGVRNGPGAGGAVVLKVPVLHRSMVAITGVVQQNPVASIFGYS